MPTATPAAGWLPLMMAVVVVATSTTTTVPREVPA
jgi:hypothetical protein